MNATLAATFDAEIAALERVTDSPTEPFGYGSDLSCVDDLVEAMPELDGMTTLVLAQALARRLDCPRGGLPGDPDYGVDVRALLNKGMTDREVLALADLMRGELGKDDRADVLKVKVTPSSDGSSLAIEILCTPRDARLGGPFRFTLAVTSAQVLLNELRGAA